MGPIAQFAVVVGGGAASALSWPSVRPLQTNKAVRLISRARNTGVSSFFMPVSMAGTPETGVLFDMEDGDGLLRVLGEIKEKRFDERTILERARLFEWEESARAFLRGLRLFDQ